ncbi:MAG: response regulator [Lachnospiraceae bacterium]|nr:response regulator [Lachnospiraceae bacterium]
MYRILIVDDEKIERKGVSFLIKQMDVECELTETVNGQEALEWLEENEADILLTDVKMPHMDGIDLIRSIKEKNINPKMKIIIISGYSDFEYAKLAVKLGVSDYLLKPVDPKEFEPAMRKIMDDIDNEKIEKVFMEQSMSFMKQHYLYSLVNGLPLSDIPPSQMEVLEIKNYKRLMLMEFENTFFGKCDTDFYENIRECLYEYDKDYQYLNLNPEQGVILFTVDKSNEDYWKGIATTISKMIENTYKTNVYVAVSKSFEKHEEIVGAFEDTETLMENRFYQNDTKIYLPYENEESPLLVQIDDDTLMKQMKQDIKMKDAISLREHFDKLCLKYRSKTDFSQVYIKFIFSNLLKDFYDILPDVNELELNKEIDRLYRSNDFQTVIDIININIERIENTFSKNPKMIHREVEEVKQYIYNHYGEEIGVEILADMVYMAPSYLSCIFKKETGQNLSKFIKSYRMEKAKEMLEETQKKIVNISNDVGYPNVSYFCQSFREYFGISPQKFRSQGDI